MRALLDINVLISLLDGAHERHISAREWLTGNVRSGWASSPITQNGCARIISQPVYPNSVSTSVVLAKLARACATTHHEFWSDDISLLDEAVVDIDRIHGPRQLTDIYLVALAVHHGGRFVTFDGSVAMSAVRGASSEHLVLL